jgi:hypothetical protein
MLHLNTFPSLCIFPQGLQLYSETAVVGPKILIGAEEASSQASVHDDHQIHHRGINGLQPIPPQSEDRTTISLLPPTQCAADYENRYEVITKGIEGSEFHTIEIQ